jgi:hypothetical protein
MSRMPAALFALACGLSAATIPQMELAEVVERSPRIIQGRIVRTWSAWDASHKVIWTHAEVAVSRDLRGNAGQTLVLSELGGVVDGIEMHAPGAPKLEVGEDLVVFAYSTPGGLWRLRGWGQGKYRIERDAAGGRIVRREGFGAALIKPGAGPQAVAHSDGAQAGGVGDREPLESFLERVEALLAAEGSR